MLGSSTKPIYYLPEFETKLPSLTNKIVAITGCTSGVGLVWAKVSVRKGAAVVLLLNRPSERATKAEEEIRAELSSTGVVGGMDSSDTKTSTIIETIDCDLQDFESVKAAAATIRSKYESLDVLCNNAGVMAMRDTSTKDGYDIQMQVNHLSHFLLTKELFPLLQKASELHGEARIVNHSSIARHGGALNGKYLEKKGGKCGGNTYRYKWYRYHHSKLANAIFTMALKEKLAASTTDSTTKIKAVCAAPGYALTNLQQTSEGMFGARFISSFFCQSAEDGTMPLLEACYGPTSESGDFWEPSQSGSLSGPATKVELTAECLDEEARKMLWEKSEEAVGVFSI